MTDDPKSMLRHNTFLTAKNNPGLSHDERTARMAIAQDDADTLAQLYRDTKPNQGALYLHVCYALALDAGQALKSIITVGGFPLELDAKDGGGTLLHAAAELSRDEAVKTLLELGCDPRARNIDGKTASDLAAESGNTQGLDLISGFIASIAELSQKQGYKNIAALDRLLPPHKPRGP